MNPGARSRSSVRQYSEVKAYLLIGREIVEIVQHGEKRAEYGYEVIDRLARRLQRCIARIRQFYLTYRERSSPGQRSQRSRCDERSCNTKCIRNTRDASERDN
jgi:hypothetical protein